MKYRLQFNPGEATYKPQLFTDAIDSHSVETLIRDGVIETKDLILLIGKDISLEHIEPMVRLASGISSLIVQNSFFCSKLLATMISLAKFSSKNLNRVSSIDSLKLMAPILTSNSIKSIQDAFCEKGYFY